jgi:hypothetical protein
VELCRQRFHFRSHERGMAHMPKDDFVKQLQRLDKWSRSGHTQDWRRAG